MATNTIDDVRLLRPRETTELLVEVVACAQAKADRRTISIERGDRRDHSTVRDAGNTDAGE